MVLGRYLGPSIDVGPAMTAEIMISNGHVVPRSTLPGLILAERESPEHIELRGKFDVAIEPNIGPKATVKDFDATEELAPEWEIYGDDDSKEGMLDAPETKTTLTPEAGDNYVNVDIMLPRGDSTTRGQVINRECNAE